MRLTLIALSASYCVDALLAISTSTKASSHSCEAARRSVMTAGMAAGRTALAAAHRPRATIICRDGFFDSVTGQCNARVMHVHCHRVHRTRLCCSLGFGGRAPVLPPCSGDGCAAHMCMCMCRCRSLNTTPSHSARPTRAETRETRSRSTPYLAPSNTYLAGSASCYPPKLTPLRGGTVAGVRSAHVRLDHCGARPRVDRAGGPHATAACIIRTCTTTWCTVCARHVHYS